MRFLSSVRRLPSGRLCLPGYPLRIPTIRDVGYVPGA
jgi:hypothetical protein